jgi:hypothetical protein
MAWRRGINRTFPWAMLVFWAALAVVGLFRDDWFGLLVGALGFLAFSIVVLARVRPTLLYKPRPPTTAWRLDELDAMLTRRDDVEASLAKGHRLRAVKLFRDGTDATLAEALDAIARLEQQTPSRGSLPPARG